MSNDFEVVPIGERCAKEQRIQELEALVDKLRLEAQGYAQEACTQRSTVWAIYQGLGIQKGTWNGAPIVLETVKARIAELEAAGTILSNLLYNYAQTPGRKLITGDCEVMKRHQQNWDKVVDKLNHRSKDK